jgi:hypothetical protein
MCGGGKAPDAFIIQGRDVMKTECPPYFRARSTCEGVVPVFNVVDASLAQVTVQDVLGIEV